MGPWEAPVSVTGLTPKNQHSSQGSKGLSPLLGELARMRLAAALRRLLRPSWAEMGLGSEIHTPRVQFRETKGSEESQEHKNMLRADSSVFHAPLPPAQIFLEEELFYSHSPL